MKKIVIITDRSRIADKLGEDLRSVLKDRIWIEKYTLEQAEALKQIDGDLFLFTLGNRIEQVKDRLSHPENTLVVRRTIKEENFVKIFEIPKNTEVLVVNDNYENTLQTMALLYDLNVDNIILRPYKEGENYGNISLAITPGERDKVPKSIKKIIDIGDRCLDLATFMEILYRLQIGDDEVSKRLLAYVNLIVNSNDGIHKHYKDAIAKNIQMEQVLEMSDQGILMTLPDGEIILCNSKMNGLTGMELSEGSTKLADIFDRDVLNALSAEALDDVVLKINGRDIVVRKSRIFYEKDIYQEIYFFKDITYVKSLEQTVSGQIKSQGFVARYRLEDIIHRSPGMKKSMESLEIFARTNKTILITGESGTGKELFAQSIHNLSERRLQPFVAVNCAAVPANLLESELFGYARGAFTGASKEGKAGLFEYANNGTIFLDEIGDMPYELQSRLLRVIQEKQIMRVGSDKVIEVNVRIISATNKNLLSEIENGRFRRDLYYRLSVLPITVPPLRERKEDILPIFKSFFHKGVSIPGWVEDILISYTWPGNVRELRNVAEYYDLMKSYENCLPDYLCRSGEGDILQPRLNLKEQILHIIYKKNDNMGNVGREKIKSELKLHHNISVSEYKLRAVMDEMEREGLIQKTTGRRGTILTPLGRQYINLE